MRSLFHPDKKDDDKTIDVYLSVRKENVTFMVHLDVKSRRERKMFAIGNEDDRIVECKQTGKNLQVSVRSGYRVCSPRKNESEQMA